MVMRGISRLTSAYVAATGTAYRKVGAEQHLGGGGEVERVATRPRAAMNIADIRAKTLAGCLRSQARSHTKPESSRIMYVEVSDEAACSAGSFAINPFAR